MSNEMTVLILGATGSFGAALTKQMLSTGWQVRAVSRKVQKGPVVHTPENEADSTGNVNGRLKWYVGDLDSPSSLSAAANNVDVIVHAVNVPYPKWDPVMPNYTRNIIDLARVNDAHLLFVGNIYNAGIPSGGVITEHTPNAPINDKGEIRAQLEGMIQAACEDGLRATTMRFGDFFGPETASQNWFKECTKSLNKNKLVIAGPKETAHTWAYLPDAAKACEQVLCVRLSNTKQASYRDLPFAGHVFSFGQLHTLVEAIADKPVAVSSQPWKLFSVLQWVMPVLRDVLAMRYLWNHDIRMDGRALEKLLGTKPHQTPLKEAVRLSLSGQ